MTIQSVGWTPSTLRAIVWPVDMSARTLPQAAATWPMKRAPDCDDFVIDLGAWLADIDDAVVSVSAVSTPAGSPTNTDLAIGWVSVMNGRPVLLLTGGAPGANYTVMTTITTAAGRRVAAPITISIDATVPWQEPILIPVVNGYPVAPNALVGDAGTVVCDENGTPLLYA